MSHQRNPQFAPDVKRLVDIVARGPQDDDFYPAAANETVFRREWETHHNAVPEIVEIGYQGNASWGHRITIPLRRNEIGDLLSWVALRIRPRSWMGPELEAKINSGNWDYQDLSGAWMWAASLGTIAIANVELQVGDTVVEQWPGEWMDIWSRLALDAGRSSAWDADIYGQIPSWALRDINRPAWTTISPTEDGYVYCWLPLGFFRRPQLAFPLAAIGDTLDVRLNVNFRPFSEVVRRRAIPLAYPGEVPLGREIVLLDKSGATPVPYVYTMPSEIPPFEDMTVLAGAVQLEDPLRSSYMRQPFEMMYEPVSYEYFDTTNSVARQAYHSGDVVTKQGGGAAVLQTLALTSNGPLREILFFLRRKNVWRWNEWTNYGALPEDKLVETITPGQVGVATVVRIPRQLPMLYNAQLWGGNAVWRNEAEQWWRGGTGLAHRGGVRSAGGMVYGYLFGTAANADAEDLQPMPTFNASRSDLELDLMVNPPTPDGIAAGCEPDSEYAWDVHVFTVGINWLRFVNGLVAPLFRD
jgi:hypothetical protein